MLHAKITMDIEMANKEKRAKRAKIKAKENRISKLRDTVRTGFNPSIAKQELKSITTELIGDNVPGFDSEIAKYINIFEVDDYAGNEMDIAILNGSNEVYRTIKTYGMKPFMDLIFFLQGMELRDIYQDVTINSSGYDAVFILDNITIPEDYTSFEDLNLEKYQVIYDDYILKSKDEREHFLTKTAENHGLSFDPEKILEMVIEKFKTNLTDDSELIKVANSSTLKWYQIANIINAAGFSNYYELMTPLIKECEYELGEGSNNKNHFVDIPDHLLYQLTAWVEYMDGEPPIDNNEDFSALVKNRPSWSFNMCAVYWKFAYELTSDSFTETPDDNVKVTVKSATERAFQNSSYLSV